jgi:hypothetical protein
MAMNEQQAPDQTICPKCGEWNDDWDGFGVLKCSRCDFCAHPSRDAHDRGEWVCGLCGDVEMAEAPR